MFELFTGALDHFPGDGDFAALLVDNRALEVPLHGLSGLKTAAFMHGCHRIGFLSIFFKHYR